MCPEKLCERCGKPFYYYPCESSRKFCSSKCRYDAAKIRIPRTCKQCGKSFEVRPSELIYNSGLFCSLACSYAYAKKEKARHWQGKSHETACVICGKVFTARAYRERDGKDKCCSKECANKWQGRHKTLAICEHCGKEFMPAHSMVNRARFCSRACYYQHKAPTSIETSLMDGLATRGIVFSAQYRIGRYSVDIAIVSHRLAIEADGEYWHRSDKVKERDARKTAYLKKQGWEVIRFSERQIKTHLNDCLIKIVRLVYVQLPCIP